MSRAAQVNNYWELVRPHLKALKAVGDAGNYQAVCPLGEHRTGKPFSVHPVKRVWRCFNGHGAGTLKQLAERLGLATGAVPHVDWGLNAAMVRYGIRVHEKGVAFPVFDHDGVPCRRHVRLHRGEPRFQWWDKGGRTYHALVEWDLVREWGASSGIAYLVEGNRDWLTLAAHGWPAVGILGVNSFYDSYRDAFPQMRDSGIGAVVITPDNDPPGLRSVTEWVSFLSAEGFAVGVRVLPELVAGRKIKDTFDFFQATGPTFDAELRGIPVVWRQE